MGRRGRKPAPTVDKIRRGNPGKRKVNVLEPAPPPASSTACPAWLTSDARIFWERCAPELQRLGLLTVIDLPKFEALCQSYKRWRQYERLTDRLGAELAIAKGYRNQALKERQQFAQLAASFGLDPSSRSNVKATPPRQADSAEELRKKFFAV